MPPSCSTRVSTRLCRRRAGWAYALGSATLALILLQLFSGIFLLLDYVPSVNDAFNSLDYLRSSDGFGAWVRGLHLWGSYTLIFVIGLHMLRTFLSASYKRPRELNWVSGAVLFFLVLGLAITGAMLPWDQAAYWTTVVVTNIPHYLPFIGDGSAHPVARRRLRRSDHPDPDLRHPHLGAALPALQLHRRASLPAAPPRRVRRVGQLRHRPRRR